MKRCSRCKEEKPVGEFWRNASSLDGRYDYCCPCAKQYKRDYRRGRHKVEPVARVCPKCGVFKEGSEFFRDASSCKPCHTDYNRRRKLLREYGLTVADYDRMLEEQGGRCAICESTQPGGFNRNFNVDHCHRTGVVRGLLCALCNTAIGKLNDDPERLRAAIRYLERGSNGPTAHRAAGESTTDA